MWSQKHDLEMASIPTICLSLLETIQPKLAELFSNHCTAIRENLYYLIINLCHIICKMHQQSDILTFESINLWPDPAVFSDRRCRSKSNVYTAVMRWQWQLYQFNKQPNYASAIDYDLAYYRCTMTHNVLRTTTTTYTVMSKQHEMQQPWPSPHMLDKPEIVKNVLLVVK